MSNTITIIKNYFREQAFKWFFGLFVQIAIWTFAFLPFLSINGLSMYEESIRGLLGFVDPTYLACIVFGGISFLGIAVFFKNTHIWTIRKTVFNEIVSVINTFSAIFISVIIWAYPFNVNRIFVPELSKLTLCGILISALLSFFDYFQCNKTGNVK